MSEYKIAVIVGSLRKDSFTRKLASAIVKLAPSEFSFKQVQIGDLPLYNQDDDANQAESVKQLKIEIKGAQGILFVTPEYNRSIPGVLDQSPASGSSAWSRVGLSPGPLVPFSPVGPGSLPRSVARSA